MFIVISKQNLSVSIVGSLPATMEGDEYEYLELTEGQSTLGARYTIVNEEIVDQFPDLTDEEVIAQLNKREAEKALALEKANAPATSTQLTKLQFMSRFTISELASIYTAAKTEVLVEVFLDKLKLANDIDLSDQNTIEGVKALVLFGLITEERATQLLAI